MAEPRNGGKSASAFRTISEVSADLGVPQHVLRFWESKFAQVRPLKRGGRRRYYRPEDIALLKQIQSLLRDDGYTIKGVQRLFREGQIKSIAPGEAARAKAGAAGQPEVDGPKERLSDLANVVEELRALKQILESARAKTR